MYVIDDIVLTTDDQIVIIVAYQEELSYPYIVTDGVLSWSISEDGIKQVISKYFDNQIIKLLQIIKMKGIE